MGKHSKPEDEKKSKRRAKKKDIEKGKNKDNKKTNSKRSNGGKTQNKKESKHIVRKIFLTLLTILIIAVLAFGVIVYKNGGGIKGVVTTFVGTDVDTVRNLDDIYVLCMGKSQNLTDTIMVAKYSPKTQQASLLSIPRDSFVGKSKDSASPFDKLNARYSISPQSTINAVNDLTGLNLKYYVTVDTKALRDLVDALGGIEFDVPIDMDYDDPTQDLEIHLKQGVQVLNGMQAEGVVRFRHNNDGSSYPEEYGDNDLGRMKTQRAFITTVVKNTLKASNITKINQLMNIAKEEVETNLSWDIIKNYIVALMDFDTENLQTDSLPGTAQYINEYSFFLVNKTEAKQKVNEMFLTTPVVEENTENADEDTNNTNTATTTTTSKSSNTKKSAIKLEVLNGTGSNSKFTTAIDQLKSQGYTISKKGTTNVTAKTLIINRKNNTKESENEIKSLLCTGATTNGEDNNDVDFTIIVGTDY